MGYETFVFVYHAVRWINCTVGMQKERKIQGVAYSQALSTSSGLLLGASTEKPTQADRWVVTEAISDSFKNNPQVIGSNEVREEMQVRHFARKFVEAVWSKEL